MEGFCELVAYYSDTNKPRGCSVQTAACRLAGDQTYSCSREGRALRVGLERGTALCALFLRHPPPAPPSRRVTAPGAFAPLLWKHIHTPTSMHVLVAPTAIASEPAVALPLPAIDHNPVRLIPTPPLCSYCTRPRLVSPPPSSAPRACPSCPRTTRHSLQIIMNCAYFVLELGSHCMHSDG